MPTEREIITHVDKLTAECEALLRIVAFFARSIKLADWSPEHQRMVDDYFGGDPALKARIALDDAP